MISKQFIGQLLKLTNTRFLSKFKKSKENGKKSTVDPPKLNPEVVVFGKEERTGAETVEELENLGVFTAMPKQIQKGKVAHIYQRSKNVMQQGTDNTKDWILEFGTETRWENPTMGWCSSGNPVSNMFMIFPSMCAAICYAEKQNLKYAFVESKPKKEFRKNYSDNFTWNKRTRVSTK